MSAQANSIIEARFSPKLKVYFWISGALILIATIAGILLLPFWVVLGGWWASRYHASLSCRLTERSVVIGKGVFFKQELTIPLDKIQDVSIHEGPLLNAMGLLRLRIETAGQRSAATGQSEADLVGVMDARTMRDQILTQRDRLAERGFAGAGPAPVEGAAGDGAVLGEIRDALLRIEARLGERG
ncbi:MAG: PH domain-containing protein [Brevundimonas sp.]|uniref:PH domain-containing protein n=1 Tax=Brevundimonas sp. TaxID=1871086 RepID=UPI00391C99A2